MNFFKLYEQVYLIHLLNHLRKREDKSITPTHLAENGQGLSADRQVSPDGRPAVDGEGDARGERQGENDPLDFSSRLAAWKPPQ